ncbi:cell wall hydrolase [Neobacillus thermocopriae]|nr:cell wall hydrolase [Neobacillus thermocopriae]MED3623487.1 cell wall hydrolase [Neobacillus thermocopriae]MED3715233.1 cell wall hydrolase [Neobacillus thermocopriae]
MKKLLATLAIILSLSMVSPVHASIIQRDEIISNISRELSTPLENLAIMDSPIQNLDLIYAGEMVHTIKSEASPSNAPEIKVGYSKREIDLLARLVRAEAEIEPFRGKIAVACVVLNRVASPKFPDTIKEVIYQKNQFQPVMNGKINQPADQESIQAVHEAINEHRYLAADSLYFYNPDIATSRWLDSRATTLVIGNHVFKK